MSSSTRCRRPATKPAPPAIPAAPDAGGAAHTIRYSTGPLTGDCGRCLEPVSDELVVDFRELFAYPDSTTDATTEQDEVHRLDGDYLDAEPVVRDAIVLGLPFTPLCRPDCAGLCPACGQRLDELPADHTHEVLDPRWAALAAFTDTAPGDQQRSADAPDQLD